MAQAKDRTSAKADHTSKTNGSSPTDEAPQTYINAPAPEDEGNVYIGKWLAPIRAQALAQLRAQGPTSDLSAEEAERMLVRSHCVAQVSNIESSSIVEKAARNGKKITVDGWSVFFSCFVALADCMAGSMMSQPVGWSICKSNYCRSGEPLL